jgi:hypothetical protein
MSTLRASAAAVARVMAVPPHDPAATIEQRPVDSNPDSLRKSAMLGEYGRLLTVCPQAFTNPPPHDALAIMRAHGASGKGAARILTWWGRRCRAANKADLVELVRTYSFFIEVRERFPAAFTERVPLAIGIHEELVALDLDEADVGRLLRWWCSQPAYRAAINIGSLPRIHLDGTVQPLEEGEALLRTRKEEKAAQRPERTSPEAPRHE